MNLLTVFAHPIRNSYPGAVMDAFLKPALEMGHAVDVLDLHAENFDPRFTEKDHACFWGGTLPKDIPPMHKRVENADQLAFVFPVYWWSMPALMKGWIDRVFTGGWAYQYGDGVEDRGKAELHGRLTNLPTVLIGVGGSKKATYEKYDYGKAMQTQLDLGIFAYCGITDVQSHLIYDVEGEHNVHNRERGLDAAENIGRAFICPHRTRLNAKEDFLRVKFAGN